MPKTKKKYKYSFEVRYGGDLLDTITVSVDRKARALPAAKCKAIKLLQIVEAKPKKGWWA